ncbi:MAG: hypothetical protein CM15mP120_04710 [Pseudomonadota bacterium]|nr:MAG: hypothetical protein CM15mP120_04710 [Pseudomonadota bacterium]
MPVVLSHPLTQIHCKLKTSVWSGSREPPARLCVQLFVQRATCENRTVLLIGEFGNADDDPPVKVLIVDDLFSELPTAPR